jgi:xanthine dehydrogenase accessory factor
VDPVCGMTVTVNDHTLHLDRDGRTIYFCGPGCMKAYQAS